MTVLDPDAALRAIGIMVEPETVLNDLEGLETVEIPQYVLCIRCGRLTPMQPEYPHQTLCIWCEQYFEMRDYFLESEHEL